MIQMFGNKYNRLFPVTALILFGIFSAAKVNAQSTYKGKYFEGKGDIEYLELLDKAYRMMRPDAELENLSMLYYDKWNGFVEGPTWDAWWIQNSFGPTYTMLPFMDKAYHMFVNNAQYLWFSQMGDGKRKGAFGYVAPEGSLCDAARPGWIVYRQGDARHDIHDWGFGFTAAGIIMQAELMLVNRDLTQIRKYMPMLEKCAGFIDSRRDPEKNIFLIGTGGNLLAPSYAGSGDLLDDGTYEMAYLAEISVNYIAALERLIELAKLLEEDKKVKLYEERLKKVRDGLRYFITDEGYFLRAIEKDGTPHGLYGAPKYGYFEATPNHDAMAFRVVDDAQTKKIYNKINSIPGLRPHKLILPNYPSYDDMYEYDGLFTFGRWVNGGHWTTCEARMQLGYYRAGAYNDARVGFKQILKMATVFQLDNPLSDFGAERYQKKLATNCTYDAFGAPGGFLRGLFEYKYQSDGLIIYPHIPEGIIRLQQKFPVYFGEKKIYIMTNGVGPLTSVLVNGKKFKEFGQTSVYLKMDSRPESIYISLGLGGQPAERNFEIAGNSLNIREDRDFWNINDLLENYEMTSDQSGKDIDLGKVWDFYQKLDKEGFADTYEYSHAGLILENVQAIYDRRALKKKGELPMLSDEGQAQADKMYIDTVHNLYRGLNSYLETNRNSTSKMEKQIAEVWFGI